MAKIDKKEIVKKVIKKLKSPKDPKKKGLWETFITEPLEKRKKAKKKFKTDEQKFVKQEKDTIIDLKSQATTATKGAEDTYNALSDAQKKIHDAGISRGMSKTKILAYIAGGGTLLGLGKFGYDVKKKMGEMNKGGSVRRMNAGGSVSRGTGAAIRGTKFKGVF